MSKEPNKNAATSQNLPRESALKHLEPGILSEDRSFVKALARGLMILEAFSKSDSGWMTATEIAESVKLPQPTVMRFLRSLQRTGYLHNSENRRQYRLGAGVLALGYAAREPFSLGELARPYLYDLANTYNVHASLAKRDRLDAIELEVCHSLKTLMTLQLEVGSRLPLAGTATGMALIAALPPTEYDYLMNNLQERHSQNWHHLLPQIEAACAEVASVGYVTAHGSWNTDINGVAVPLVSPGGSPVFSLACGAPALHLSREKQHVIGERLLDIKAAIEEKIRSGEALNSRKKTP